MLIIILPCQWQLGVATPQSAPAKERNFSEKSKFERGFLLSSRKTSLFTLPLTILPFPFRDEFFAIGDTEVGIAEANSSESQKGTYMFYSCHFCKQIHIFTKKK